MQPFSAIHDPYAGATPSMRLRAAERRIRLERIAAQAKPDNPVIAIKVVEPKPEPEILLVKEQSWADRQWKLHNLKEPWFYVEDEIDPVLPIPLRIEDIIREVCRFYHIFRVDLVSERRTAFIVRIRQIGMFLTKEMTGRSLPDIGRHFGGRDHTTVLHACRKINRRRETDSELADELNSLREAIRSAN